MIEETRRIFAEMSTITPMSVCRCGHTGDGGNSEHRDSIQRGHGACKVVGCTCRMFTWVKWTDKTESMLKKENFKEENNAR